MNWKNLRNVLFTFIAFVCMVAVSDSIGWSIICAGVFVLCATQIEGFGHPEKNEPFNNIKEK